MEGEDCGLLNDAVRFGRVYYATDGAKKGYKCRFKMDGVIGCEGVLAGSVSRL